MDGNRFDSVVQELTQAKTRRRLIGTLLAALGLSLWPTLGRAAQFFNDCDSPCGFGETCRNGQCECSSSSQTKCGYSCVSLSSSQSNCGGCGVSCGYDETCRNGQCQCSFSGQTKCGGICVSLNSQFNCGGCGVSCGYDETCRSGRCECTYSNQTKCGYSCVNLDSNPFNCGGCGVSCGFGEQCQNGQCTPSSVTTRAPVAPISTYEPLTDATSSTPAGSSDAEAVESAMRDIVESINAENYVAAASLMTDPFLQNFLGVEDRNDALARVELAGPIDVRSFGNPLRFADSRLSIDVEETGFFTGTRQIHYARWFFQDEGGVYKLDGFLNLVFTESMLPSVVIDVQLFDFAFALNGDTVPASTPIIFRTTNNSSHGDLHKIHVVTLPAGTTSEQIIDGTINPFGAVIAYLGGIDVESGATADLALESLRRGTYFLLCPMLERNGTRHYELGMVTEFLAQRVPHG